MRKAILYILLILLLSAALTLAYGFYNAKNIRSFAASVKAIEKKNDFDGELQSVQEYFQSPANQDARAIQEKTANFESQLEGVIKKTENSQKETESLKAPRMALVVKNQIVEYNKKIEEQALSCKYVLGFINNISEVSSVFGSMNDQTSLADIKSLIAEAKTKSSSISSSNLPAPLKGDADNLVRSYQAYLGIIEEAAASRSENQEQLENAYNDFSRSDDQFFLAARQYILQMENLAPEKSDIDSRLEGFSGIYFSLK